MADGEPSDTAQPSELRASDAERERTATLLREHTAAGRLTPEELAERLEVAYAARTVGELEQLGRDLPAAPPPPEPRERALDWGGWGAGSRGHLIHVIGLLVLINVAANGVWLATGAGSWWPKWILVLSLIRGAFALWNGLGPGAAQWEARHGRGGAHRIERTQRRIDRH